MRYQNWDVLVFPERSKIPLQEFKTTCHVIHDQESFHQRNNMVLLPTVTSFIQGLPTGEQFRISVHSWEDPEPSRYAHNFTKHVDLVMFEARVFIDGRLAGAKVFARGGPWPTIIETSLEMNKNGEMESLKFPVFHSELLTQSYWNAGDEHGRIKIVIAEGCSRDPLSTTLERIKNVVAFSFQHAPLDVLEASAIAWPNATMWRQVSLNASYLTQGVSPSKSKTVDVEAHSHSPRLKVSLARSAIPPPTLGPMLPPDIPVFSRTEAADPFVDSFHHWRQASSIDTSMPDYSGSVSRASHSRRGTDSMMADRPERHFETIQSDGAYESICEALIPSAPVNTPQDSVTNTPDNVLTRTNATLESEIGYYPIKYEANHSSVVPKSASNRLAIKGRKENLHEPSGAFERLENIESIRKIAQPFIASTSGGTKRQRIVTPASFKVIDEEDEPRSSPTRKGSQTATQHEVERRALGGIEVNII